MTQRAEDATPPELTAWLQARFGKVAVSPAPGHHRRVHTWRVQRGAERWYVRWDLPPRKHAQECRVAREVWSALPGLCPQLVCADDRGLVMSAAAGTPDTGSPAAAAAGRALARLHALPHHDTDPLPLAPALARRAATQCRLLEDHGLPVPPALRTPPTTPGPRRWCHRDLQPDNWLWDGKHITFVDWEHARPDAPVLDLAKVATLPCWPALAAGYRAGGGTVDPAALRFALALHGAATLSWAHAHDDRVFAAEGRRVLGVLAARGARDLA